MLINNPELNKLAEQFIEYKKAVEESPNAELINKFKKHQELCMKKMAPLVMFKARKYKSFSNYNDLVQDGFEGLLLSLRTYNINKGEFSFWASQYIKTRIYRAANSHSTIKFPLKTAKENRPYKVHGIPDILDTSINAHENLFNSQQSKIIGDAMMLLTEEQRQAIIAYYDFKGRQKSSLTAVCKSLKVCRLSAIEILNSALNELKEELEEAF